MEQEFLKILNKLLNDIGLDRIEILEDTLDLRSDLQIDSISMAELMVLMEEHFEIDISLSKTIGDVKELLNKNKNKNDTRSTNNL